MSLFSTCFKTKFLLSTKIKKRLQIFFVEIRSENNEEKYKLFLADFGISRRFCSEKEELKEYVGTPAYMSPESFKNVESNLCWFSLQAFSC